MGASSGKSHRLRELLNSPGVIVAPAAYDCISIRIIERAGFPAALHGGYNSAASMLGLPDIGLATLTEMLHAARNLAAAVSIPVICDIDEGFGSLLSADRAIREAIRSGLAGLYIEDQVFPKRSPSLGGNQVITTSEMVKKLRVLDRARAEEDPNFVIVARTHSARAVSIQEALERGLAYAEAGADAIFVDLAYGPQAVDELELIGSHVGAHTHVVANMSETVGRPLLTSAELYEMGFKIVIYPLTALMAAAYGVAEAMRELSERGTTAGIVGSLMPLSEIAELTGITRTMALEEQWRV